MNSGSRGFFTYNQKHFFSQFNNKFQSKFFSTNLNSLKMKGFFASGVFLDKINFIAKSSTIVKTFSIKNTLAISSSENVNSISALTISKLASIIGFEGVRFLTSFINWSQGKQFIIKRIFLY